MRYQIILLCIATLFILNPAIVQGKTEQPISKSSINLIPSIIKTDEVLSTKEHIAILNEQNKIIREYQSSLLTTVHWALGVIFGIALLLTGFNWWTNNRIYEADKSRFMDEVGSQIKEMESRVALDLEASRTEFLRLTESRIDANVSRLLSDISEIKNHIEKVRSDIEKSILSVQKDIGAVGDTLKETAKSISAAEWDLRQVESNVWEIKGIPANILITQNQGLRAALESKKKLYIDYTLGEIKKTIKEKITPVNESVPRAQIDNLLENLKNAADYNPVLAAEVVELAKVMKVRD
jgi:hypothetical protein